MKTPPRATLVATSTMRRSTRSTKTPAGAEKTTAGTRKVRISRLTDALEPAMSATITVNPKSTMLPPIWLATWASQSARKRRLRSTPPTVASTSAASSTATNASSAVAGGDAAAAEPAVDGGLDVRAVVGPEGQLQRGRAGDRR